MATVNYYVNTSTGNDTTGDGSIGTPWATLQKALNDAGLKANSGNAVIVNCAGSAADTGAIPAQITSSWVADSILLLGQGASAQLYDTSKYRLEATDDTVFDVRSFAGEFIIDQFQAKVTNSVGSTSNFSFFTTPSAGTAAKKVVKNSRLEMVQDSTTGTGTFRGFLCSNSGNTSTDNAIVNCVINVTGAGTSTVTACEKTSGAFKYYNNVISGADNGIVASSTTLKNNVLIGCTDAISGGSNTMSNNFTDDNAGDSGSTDINDWTAEFENYSSGDFRLKSTSTNLLNGGADVSAENGSVSVDIQGTARGIVWDAGPHEAVDLNLAISDVDTDEIITSTQTGVVVTGLNFEASQGDGAVTIDGIGQTETAWGATSATISVVQSTLGYGSHQLRVTNASDSYDDIAITMIAPSGLAYVVLQDAITDNTSVLYGSVGTVEDGYQIEHPDTMTVYADGTFYVDAAGVYNLRLWDQSEWHGFTVTVNDEPPPDPPPEETTLRSVSRSIISSVVSSVVVV